MTLARQPNAPRLARRYPAVYAFDSTVGCALLNCADLDERSDSVKNRINFRRGLHRIFLFLSVVWLIGVFAYPLYTQRKDEQISTREFDECLQKNDAGSELNWCEDKFKIEMNYDQRRFVMNYEGEMLAFNIAIALFVPPLTYGIIRLVLALANWLRRGFTLNEPSPHD